MRNKLFSTSIIISFIMHGIVIGYLSSSRASELKVNNLPKPIEVTYQKTKLQEKQPRVTTKEIKVVKSREPIKKIKVLSKGGEDFSSLGERVGDLSKITRKWQLEKKTSTKIDPVDLERKITIPQLNAEKISNPQYLTYNNNMRLMISRNIKERAYSYVNDPDFQDGEVYIAYVLMSSGVLKEIRIVEEKTTANAYLRQMALKSVKDASPFLPFPKEFDYPELTFNVLISFQN